MTAEQLLKPRFQVIADYPFNPHAIGAILEAKIESIHQTTYPYRNEFGETVNCENYCHISSFEKLPHLFRKLNWWEKRKKEDMPKKLICKAIPNDTEIMEIIEWDMDLLIGILDKEARSCCNLRTFNPKYGYFPVD
jgi:hypothetical protein